jgi:HEAT repeat protein
VIKKTCLLLTATLCLRAQKDFPPLHDLESKLERLSDLDFQMDIHHEKLAKLQHEISAKVSTKVSDAMSKLDLKMPAFMASQAVFHGGRTDHERSYEGGIQALDRRHYERALEAFSQAAMTAGSRTDGALFWKAYTLHRLGRRDEALAALAELRKSHAASRWLGDAQALETEIKQTTGQKQSAQWDAEEDLKVQALSGLIQSDPERAAPLVEQILKSSPSRKLKERALQAIANSDSQRSRDLLAQIARGKAGNPDLELRAIRYLGNRRTDNRQLLREIYSSTTDEQVKRAVLRALRSSEDKEELTRIVKSEKEPSIRMEAVSLLGDSASAAELWPLYQAETSVDVKERILHRLKDLGATDRLLEVSKTEKEPRLRQQAIRALGSVTTGDALVALHGSETDPAVKRAIIDSLYSHKNGGALVNLARKEKDPQVRREIVSRLSRMRSKEASDYLMEILK